MLYFRGHCPTFQSFTLKLSTFIGALWPQPLHVNGRERFRAALGAAIGIALTAWLCLWFVGSDATSPWLVAPIGASAVLIFAVPSSPLAQPWAVIGGNTLSALIGASCAVLIPDPAWAGAAAVGVAIGVMFALRCLHPPGGAAALLAAMAGVDLHFVLFPVLANCVLIVAAGMLYNAMTGRRYPHVAAPPRSAPGTEQNTRFTTADLNAALEHYNQVVDVNRDELETLLRHAEAAAFQRKFGDLRCADIMARDVQTANFGTPLDQAWSVMQKRRIKALPVVDRVGRIVGIVTVADFMRHAGMDKPRGIHGRLRRLVTPSGRVHSEKPEVIGQIMTTHVRKLTVDRHLTELVPLFADGGHHHIPIVDHDDKLAGIITQTDLVKALYGATHL
ncbi:HPP family protein [Alcaligenaceae bacterium C4P045]|nr:HPP family protein [Alcaligenaceae bacterium C4P045]